MTHWRKGRDYRYWRVAVIRRDKVCQVCGSNKSRQAHHLNNGEHHPDERYDIDNGICLCSACHMNYHCNFNRSYRVKTTKYNWENFLVLVEYIRSLDGTV